MSSENAQQLRKRIEELHARKWSDPDSRDELDQLIDGLRARLRHIEQTEKAGPR